MLRYRNYCFSCTAIPAGPQLQTNHEPMLSSVLQSLNSWLIDPFTRGSTTSAIPLLLLRPCFTFFSSSPQLNRSPLRLLNGSLASYLLPESSCRVGAGSSAPSRLGDGVSKFDESPVLCVDFPDVVFLKAASLETASCALSLFCDCRSLSLCAARSSRSALIDFLAK